jgi:hypothetical protein
MIRTLTNAVLPYPFDLLGQRTLTEFKGPHDTATETELETLEIYGLLYRRRHHLPARADLTLWLIASRISGAISNPAGTFIHEMRDVGPGVRGGALDGFPVYLIELDSLPITAETLPLMMVYKGKREVELAEFVVEHRHEFPEHLTLLVNLHAKAFAEVLKMQKVDVTDLGAEFERAMELLGKEQFNEIYGRAVDLLDEEEVLQSLARRVGRERLEQLLRELPEEKPKPRRSRRKKK